MPADKDTALGRLAVERGFLSQAQLDETLALQHKMHDEFGMDQSLEQILVSKHLLSEDQAQELRHAAAIQTGEARLVAGYEVISKLGQGGMGAVYKAKHRTSGQFVALKVLPPSLATDELVKRFRREAEVVRQLDHENIVACTEFGFDKRRKVHFCALELVEGEDLAKRITRLGRLTEDEALSITSQIAMALQHAFFNGLVHRDVKPENVMVTADGTAKLLDLGLARPANQEATRLTESGMFVGSPYYASPEQAMGEREIDTRSDIYSLGAALYHMVTGKPPFEGTTALAILQKHVNEKLPWPAEVNPDLSDGLCMIIAKMMEKSPDDRYQTPNDLNRDLDLLIEGNEPEVEDAALKNSSVKVPAVRPRRRRLPTARERGTKERDRRHREPAGRRRRDSAREHRREAGREGRAKPSGRPALPTGAKIAIGAGALGLMVVIGLVMSLDGKEPDRRPPKRGSSRDTLRTRPDKVPPESVPPGAGQPTVEARKVSPPVSTPPDVGKAEPPKTLTLDLGGGVKMEFVHIKPGTFVMGGTEDPKMGWDGVEKPKHQVAVTRGFYIGKYEVTQAQYEAIMGENPSKWQEPGRPVQQVTWHEAAEFCRLATEGTRRRFRLPTEAEWEYACRAGSTKRYCFGDSKDGLGDYAWYNKNSGGQTHPVGQKKPNAWGLYDMHGNVWEWVADWHAKNYYANSPREDPTGPDTGSHRLLRSGAWHTDCLNCRSATRIQIKPSVRHNHHGFRAVVSASPPVPKSAVRPPNVPPDAVEFGGHWYKLYKQQMTWHDAKTYCEKQGGHLVTITSEEENEFVTAIARRVGRSPWIGFTDERTEGEWEWITGEKTTFSGWSPRDPDNYGGLDHVALIRKKKGYLWADEKGTGTDALICEWEPGWKPPPPPPQDLKRGLVGWWRFDETQGNVAHDSSGKDNHGTVKGDAKWTTGRIDGALEFDGRCYVDVPSGVTEFGKASFTVSVWLKTTTSGAAILSKSNNDTTWSKGEKQFYVSACATPPHLRNREKPIGSANLVGCFSGFISGSAVVSDGEWHNIAWTWDAVARRGTVCVDSAPGVTHVSYNRLGDNARSKVRIGFDTCGAATTNFIGLLDDVRIYNRALSGEEVKALHDLGAEGTKAPTTTPESGAPPPTLTLDLGGGVTMDFVYIKPGVFTMGGTEDPKYGWQGVEKPKHEVAITQGFYIGKYEVTQAQYEAAAGGNPSKWKEPNRPVEQVTWHEAVEFCRLVGERTGREVRLPTEAEWEYACRAGSTGRYCFGSDERGLGEYAWFKNNSGGQTHHVGQKKPNQWGLYDVHGNVWEWVADWYAADYYAKSPRENPTGPDRGQHRLLRGGGWYYYGHRCRCAIRFHETPTFRSTHLGFRVAVSASPPRR